MADGSQRGSGAFVPKYKVYQNFTAQEIKEMFEERYKGSDSPTKTPPTNPRHSISHQSSPYSTLSGLTSGSRKSFASPIRSKMIEAYKLPQHLEEKRLAEKTDRLQREKEYLKKNLDVSDKFNDLKKGMRGDDAIKNELKQLSAYTAPNIKDDINPQSLCSAHYDLEQLARDMNSTLESPEIVLLGLRGHGKSTLIEALIGQIICEVNFTPLWTTKRIIHYQFINSASVPANNPKCTIKYDSFFKDHNVSVPLSALPAEIASRQSTLSANAINFADPLFIQIEMPNILNLTIIDTPGLVAASDDHPERETIRSDLLSFISSRQTATNGACLFLLVEETNFIQRSELIHFVKSFDPNFYQSVLVFTKFHEFVDHTFHSQSEVINQYLHSVFRDGKIRVYWTSTPTLHTRVSAAQNGNWKERVAQSNERDKSKFELLRLKKKYANRVGILNLRKEVWRFVWKKYLERIPKVYDEGIQGRVKGLETAREVIGDFREEIGSKKNGGIHVFRGIAMEFCSEFSEFLNSFLRGNSVAGAKVAGMTLEHETTELGEFFWLDKMGQPIKIPESVEQKIVFRECKVYGGQQFERVLSEFFWISQNLSVKKEDLNLWNVIAATGTRSTSVSVVDRNESNTKESGGTHTMPDFLWSACEISTKLIKENFVPLIDCALSRIGFIFQKIGNLVMFEILKNWNLRKQKRLKRENKTCWESDLNGLDGIFDIYDIANYPYFMNFIKVNYLNFLNELSSQCKRKVMDDFYSADTIYWGFSENLKKKNKLNFLNFNDFDADSYFEVVKEIFDYSKEKLVKNVIMKFYWFWVEKVINEVPEWLNSKVNGVPDSVMEEKFGSKLVREKVMTDTKRILAALELLHKEKEQFRNLSVSFTVSLVRALQS